MSEINAERIAREDETRLDQDDQFEQLKSVWLHELVHNRCINNGVSQENHGKVVEGVVKFLDDAISYTGVWPAQILIDPVKWQQIADYFGMNQDPSNGPVAHPFDGGCIANDFIDGGISVLARSMGDPLGM